MATGVLVIFHSFGQKGAVTSRQLGRNFSALKRTKCNSINRNLGSETRGRHVASYSVILRLGNLDDKTTISQVLWKGQRIGNWESLALKDRQQEGICIPGYIRIPVYKIRLIIPGITIMNMGKSFRYPHMIQPAFTWDMFLPERHLWTITCQRDTAYRHDSTRNSICLNTPCQVPGTRYLTSVIVKEPIYHFCH